MPKTETVYSEFKQLEITYLKQIVENTDMVITFAVEHGFAIAEEVTTSRNIAIKRLATLE